MNTPADVPLRLVTITHCFPAHGGGVERVAGRLVEEFAARGVRIEWLSSDTEQPPRSALNCVATPLATFNFVERLTQLPYPIWKPCAISRLWKAIGTAHVVHIHEHLYVGSIMATVIARLRDRPVVITQHMGALGLGNRLLTALYAAGARLLGALLFPAAARSIFVSANVCRFFNRQSDQRSRLLFNGIDVKQFTAVPSDARRLLRIQLGMPFDRRVVLFVGRFVRKKGLRILEALTQKFPEVLWVCVGSGPEDPAKWQHVNVRVVGRVEHDRLAAYYQASDLLLLPSYGEGFPLVVQEALACGLAVLSTEEVATACPAAQHMIRSLPTPRGRVAIGAWEEGIRATLHDDRYLEARASRSEQARRLWSWERCAAGYLEVFDEVHPGR